MQWHGGTAKKPRPYDLKPIDREAAVMDKAESFSKCGVVMPDGKPYFVVS